MNASLRKGRCPGALRPMMAHDGLLVRLRVTGGVLAGGVAEAIADLTERHGNGLIDLSARANLQMRGIHESALPALWDGLRALDLLDATGDAEAVRNVISSPLAGLRTGLDIRPIVAALEAELARDAALHVLPTKFGFLIDDGSAVSLADVPADVRFDWLASDQAFAIGLGGTATEAVRLGVCDPDRLVAVATEIARGAIRLFAENCEARRMRGLIASRGPATVISSIAENAVLAWRRQSDPASDLRPLGRFASPATTAADIVGLHTFDGLACIGLVAPFGRLEAAMLRGAAAFSDTHGTGTLRLTPWRAIIVPHATSIEGAPPGFITDADDPRLVLAACVGRDGCERGTTSTRGDATALADLGVPLHVSGCEKGCANPSASAVTLVARDGLYDLVQEGRAGDTPILRGLSVAAARAEILSLRGPA